MRLNLSVVSIFAPQARQKAVCFSKNINDTKFAGLKVLLVEDNFMNQQIAMELLDSAGIVVMIAGNGREAVKMLQSKLNVI